MPTATIDALTERLPGLMLMNAYGATETCSPATIMPYGQTAANRDSVGQVVSWPLWMTRSPVHRLERILDVLESE